MTIQLGDLIAIFMVLWKLTEYIYVVFTYRHEYRNALPEVQSIVDSLRQGTVTPEGQKRPPGAITVGAASAYGEECLCNLESRRYSVKKPAPCFVRHRNVSSQMDMAEAPERRKCPPRAITAGAASAYGEECLCDPESTRQSIKRPALRFVQRRNVPSQRDMTEALILSQIKNHDTLHQLLQMITPIYRPIDEHWDQCYIRFTNVVGAKHQLLVESCKSPEGFIYYLMSSLRDCTSRWTLLKGVIERGEFWIVDENDNWDSPHYIGSSPAILADNWEENVIAGRTFRMMAAGLSYQVTPDDLNLMHSTWHSHVTRSLREICKLSHWEFNEN